MMIVRCLQSYCLGNQQEIIVKVYLKMVSAALELAFFLNTLLNVVSEQVTE